jgi:hypothetical protein
MSTRLASRDTLVSQHLRCLLRPSFATIHHNTNCDAPTVCPITTPSTTISHWIHFACDMTIRSLPRHLSRYTQATIERHVHATYQCALPMQKSRLHLVGKSAVYVPWTTSISPCDYATMPRTTKRLHFPSRNPCASLEPACQSSFWPLLQHHFIILYFELA